MGLEPDQRGALISEVTPGGPAEEAGLRGSEESVEIDGQSVNVGGDVVIAIDDQPIQEMDDLIAYLMTKTSVGQELTLSVLRDGENVDVAVVLGARPAMQETSPQLQQQPKQPPSNPSASGAWLGIYGLPMDAELAKAMNLAEDQQGVLVIQVTPGSPAEQAGLRGGDQPFDLAGEQILVGGDVITAIDGQTVLTLEALRSYIQEQGPGAQVTLTILRGGEQMEVPATLAEIPAELP
jgi:2-alkenal reductase